MTYNEAYNKIIDAYFRDEILPLNCQFCFCGSIAEYELMETALLGALETFQSYWGINCYIFCPSVEYEYALFKGMSAALDVLKEIHIQRGEIIDEPIHFKKRKLATAKPLMNDL